MLSFNYSTARAQFSMIIDRVLSGQAVEITRQGRPTVVVISLDAYQDYCRMKYNQHYQQTTSRDHA
ncbi:type II toxin-antitoxin system Phd/YefM family antitoxin [Acinetobacter sp. MB5]|uniref:type II toxin-antitoxin system Phd/YefM family antitoxin n=1 Tax=Acinetobacter sp. MB5 TaxID=2069438 RepID=UPI000DD0AD6D|nr:type II toxin-antitoxin system prevent-host-death family antitoxin [Acinetobacter sp. MB5]